MSTFLEEKIQQRKNENTYRSLPLKDHLVDFCSNDYLGFARSEELKKQGEFYLHDLKKAGATGSRLITGNHIFIESLESQIAQFHNAEAGLILNSGYDANLGLLACIADKTDTIISDQLVHASIIDGIRLSKANRKIFKHNDLQDLESHLKTAVGKIFVVIESIYSMDGDAAPLVEIVELIQKHGAFLIVDEAHATGVFGKNGRGLVHQLQLEKVVFARVITFGKALGVHGAIILGSEKLRNYLINFCRPFIFSTGLPLHSIAAIKAAYHLLSKEEKPLDQLRHLIQLFKQNLRGSLFYKDLIPSKSAIQSLVIPNARNAKAIAKHLEQQGFYAKAIVYPTVAKGSERIRICLHAFNRETEVIELVAQIKLAESLLPTPG